MPDTNMLLLEDLQCPCNESKFTKYYSADECLGFFCQSCWKEWLLEEFLPAPRDPEVTYNGKRYLSPIRTDIQESELCQVSTSRDEVTPNYVAESLKPGDHIMWHRPYLIWHHAIVEDVSGKMVTLIHFSKRDDKDASIMRSEVDITEEWGQLYLVNYNAQVCQYNPSELVLARAKALIGMTGYQFITKNCENFATFCKSGVNTNQQSQWFYNKAKEILHSIWQNANFKFVSTLFKVGAAEMLELGAEEMKYVTRSAEAVGAGVIVAFEGGICIWNLGRLYQKYKTVQKDGRNSMSRKDFIAEMVTQISQRFFAAGLGAGGGLGLTALGTVVCPGLGTAAGAVLGIVGGCIGASFGHVAGVALGHFIAGAIVKTIKTNDRAVTIDDLEPGDHIVVYGNMFHPRCHAIVVRVHKEERHIIIIRHSYEKGVILDAIYYSGYDPVFKVMYPKDAKPSPYTSEEIVNRAIKAVAEYDQSYNILWNNCKHFVYSLTLKPE